MNYRMEKDSLGEVAVPADSLYGPQTARAVANFPISEMRFQRGFIRALGLIKAAAARANGQLQLLPGTMAAALETAALDIAQGKYDTHFPVDIYQSGSGTSTNMNANEIIARLTSSHPNDHVNLGQSSNDVMPTALHLAAVEAVSLSLLPSIHTLRASLEAKAAEFDGILKIGRTHLQDAVPMRLGQEFSGYARQVELSGERIAAALEGLYELPIGGTAIGTGLNSSAKFAELVIADLASRTGRPFRRAINGFEAQGARDAAVFLSGALRNYAVSLTKIVNDIRWLASGPRCGLGEIALPAVQPGSSIMPGKVNPVIIESVWMLCAQVVGHDSAIAWCGAGGNFELNATIPLIAWNLLDSISLLAKGTLNLELRLVRGLIANIRRTEALVEQSLAMVTALVPEIGYDRAAALAKLAAESGQTIRSIAQEKSGIDAEKLQHLLDARRQT